MKKLICTCCGRLTNAKAQWWNRDNGFGLCLKCYDWIQTKYNCTDEDMRQSYGNKGIHCAIN